MEKVIAILTHKGALSNDLQNNTTINLFKMNGENIVEVENIKLENTCHNEFSMLMTTKEVSMIYAETMSKDLQDVLEKLDIKTKCKEEMDNDDFINQFIFA